VGAVGAVRAAHAAAAAVALPECLRVTLAAAAAQGAARVTRAAAAALPECLRPARSDYPPSAHNCSPRSR